MTTKAKRIALAGIGAAFSLVMVILGYFIGNLTLTFNVLATGGMMLTLSKKYYRECVLSYAAVCLIGGLITNLSVLPFVLVGGAFTIFTVIWFEKGKKYIISLPIKIAYSAFVFFILYKFTTLLAVDFTRLNFLDSITPAGLYVIFNLVFSATFILYDYCLLFCYKYLKERVFSKIK